MNYTTTELITLKDQREFLLTKTYDHFRRCSDCWLNHQTTQEVCDLQTIRSQELESINEALNFDSVDVFSTTLYYNDPETPSDLDNYDELVADYVTTVAERTTDRWDLTPEVTDAWPAQMLLTEAVRPPDGLDDRPGREVPPKEAAWIDNELFSLVDLVNDADALQNFKSHMRIWTTNRGQIGIYKTFIKDVTDSTFTAYCAPCKRNLVLERTRRNLLLTVLHAHTHVPNSNITGDGDYLLIEGSDANPLPGTNREADKQFITKAGQWYVQTERVNGVQTELGKAWESWLKLGLPPVEDIVHV